MTLNMSGEKIDNGAGKRLIFQIGQDQLTPKACYYGLDLEAHNVKTYYFSQDKSGLSAATMEKHQLKAEIVPKNLIWHWLRYLRLLLSLKPSHIEMYLSIRPWTLFFYTVCARLLGVPIVTWCRGEILFWEQHHPLRRLANRYALRSSRLILLRELKMDEVLAKHRVVEESRTRFVPNSVPVGPPVNSDRNRNVLFMNSFKPWRNVHLVVEAARHVVDVFPDAKFEIVGATSTFETYSPAKNVDDVENQLVKLIEELNLNAHVEILPFTDDTEPYLQRAALFLLPADIVFCNFSLLEAMASGIVPIVAEVEGSDRIVEDTVSGYIVQQDAKKIAEKIIHLFENDDLRHRMSHAAKARIKEHYNTESRAQMLLELYQNEVWNRGPYQTSFMEPV